MRPVVLSGFKGFAAVVHKAKLKGPGFMHFLASTSLEAGILS